MPDRRPLRGHATFFVLLIASIAASGKVHAGDMHFRIGVDFGRAENDSQVRPGFELGLVSPRGWGLALAWRTLDEDQIGSTGIDSEGRLLPLTILRGKLESRSLLLTYLHALPGGRWDIEGRLGVHDWEHSLFDFNNEGLEGVAGVGVGRNFGPHWRAALAVEWFGVNSHRVHRLSSRLEYTFR